MKYEIVELSEKTVIGLSRKTTNENMQAISDIGLLWDEFMGKGIYRKIENKVNHRTIGLYTDYEGDFTKPYIFMTCCEVSSIDKSNIGLAAKTIKAGKYAKFSIRGHIQKAVGEAWKEIWVLDIDRAYLTDFEVYHNDSQDMNNQTVDIYISLR